MVYYYLVKVSDKLFSVFCNQKLCQYVWYRRKGSVSVFLEEWQGKSAYGKHAISLTELHAGHLLERQVR